MNNNQDRENQNKENNQTGNKKFYIIIAVLVMLILLLLLRSCGNDANTMQPQPEAPVGNFEITDQAHGKEETEKAENRTITFAGFGEYKVSEKAPSVELKNPDRNFVDMVFTLTDKETGELIAKTGKIPAGKFVYVNVMDFYKEKGVYTININISTYDSETGAEMNGMEQEVKTVVY